MRSVLMPINMIPEAISSGTLDGAAVPLSMLFGGAFLVICDLLARTVMAPSEIPIGVVTAFLGAPFFMLVLRTAKRVGL